MIIDTFECYKTFIAVKLHFSGKYDFFKYHGKVKANWKSFEKFGGKKIVYSLAKQHKERYAEYLACGFANIPDASWIGDLAGDDALEFWKKHNKWMRNSEGAFRSELDSLFAKYSVKDLLLSKDGDLPIIEKARISGLTSIETCCILDKLFNYMDRNECNHPLWSRAKSIPRYTPFLGLSLKPYKDITQAIMPR